MLNDIEKVTVRVVDVRGSHDEVARVHVLEESDSARVVVWVAAHLGQLSAGVDPHLLIPVALDNDLLRFVPQPCDEHVLDDSVVHRDCLIVVQLLVVFRDACVVGPELVLRVQCSEEHAIKCRLSDGLQNMYKHGAKCTLYETR